MPCADRLGVARLTRLAYAGFDLVPVGQILANAAGAGPAMDLALLAQLLGNSAYGMALQSRTLAGQRLYRSHGPADEPALRLLAFAADMDIGGNTPVEFLLEASSIELVTCFVIPGQALPDPLPEHDIAMLIMPDDDRCRGALAKIEQSLAGWPRQVLNRPAAIRRLDRDRLWLALAGADGVLAPPTWRVARAELLAGRLPQNAGPLVARPVGSHAGHGLMLLETAGDIATLLQLSAAAEFFASPYVDYRDSDGYFRKCRIVLVDGVAFPVHLAISEQWNIWYLNAAMAENPARRQEEQAFMDGFAEGFARRNAGALTAIHAGIGLDYVGLDCAEMPDGRLLVFEADNVLIVHDMDPPGIFPYKPPHMRRLFEAFQAMLYRRASKAAA